MKNFFICRLGMIILALSILLLGCDQPMETIYIEVPVEVPSEAGSGCDCVTAPSCQCDPDEWNGCNCDPDVAPESGEFCKCQNEESPDCIGFSFTQENPLRAAYSVNGKTVGSFNNPIGGTAPFTYALVAGNGNNDTHNAHFTITGASLKIQSAYLPAGVYFIHVGITDSKGAFYSQSITVSVAPNPVTLDQETWTVNGISFKTRYVPAGAFVDPDRLWEGANVNVLTTHIPAGFWMTETVITQELFEAIMGYNPSYYNNNPAPGEVQQRKPVESVSYYEAIIFCNRLSIATGREPVYHIWGVSDWETYLKWATSSKSSYAINNIYVDELSNGYRLPTYYEWYWVAMGADLQNPSVINYTGVKKYYSGGQEGSDEGIEFFAWLDNVTHEVGRKASNELGIYNMTGNVYEWVFDGYAVSEFGYSSFAERLRNWGKYIPYEKVSRFGFRVVSNQ